MKCPVCNAEAGKSATFCQQCGAKLPLVEGGPARAAAVADVARPQPVPGTDTVATGRRRGPVDVAEETLWEGSYSPKAMLGLSVIAVIASIAIIVLGAMYGYLGWALAGAGLLWLFVLARLAVRRLGISYKLTNQMFYHRRGVLTRSTDRIELIEVHDVTYHQGLFDRLVGTGRIKIASSDRTDPTFFLLGVENVEQVAQMIDKARRGEQVRRGRRIDFSSIDGET
jgi:hypothetical protein